MPKVSVIVPNYNHAQYLVQRIESILQQTYQDFEIILLDDFSSDNSREILEGYRNNSKISHIVINEKNSGGTFYQWIKGIELAGGDYIWIAESDDYAGERFLETAITALEMNLCSLYFSQSYVVDDQGAIHGVWNGNQILYKNNFEIEGKEIIQNYMTSVNIIPNASAVVFKKESIDSQIKKHIVQYKINGDWFLWINILMKGYCRFSSEPLNYFRRHAGAGSPKNVENFKNIEEAYKLVIYLSKNGFRINGKLWLNKWIAQAQYSLWTLCTKNFINIYKLSFDLYPFPLSYLFYCILLQQKSRLNIKSKYI